MAPAAPASAPARLRPFAGRTVAMLVRPGGFAQFVRDEVAPGFEQEHDLKLIVDEADTPEQLGRLRATRDNPQYLVMSLEEMAVSLARDEGLVARLEARDVPNLADVFPEYVLAGGFGVGHAVGWVTVWYNTTRLKKPPLSSAALWDARYQQRVAVPSIQVVPGLQWLVTSAALARGTTPAEAQYDVDSGFEKWRQLKPNLHSTYDKFSSIARLMAQGEVWIAFGDSRYASTLALQGAPIERAPIRENAFLSMNGLVLARHPQLEPLGRDLINRVLAPEAQSGLTRALGTVPVNGRAQVPAELLSFLPSVPDEPRRMIRLDWDYLNARRQSWIERWNQEVGP